jgi:hypothetical protein
MNHSSPYLNQPPGQSDWRMWLAIVFLGIGAFTIVTTELAPIGLLSAIAQDIGRSESAIGLTVTLYAWIGAFSALLAAIALGRMPRKPLLIGLMLCLALSNGAAMAADGFGLLLTARACGAIAHGLFWAVIAASAAQIAGAAAMTAPHRSVSETTLRGQRLMDALEPGLSVRVLDRLSELDPKLERLVTDYAFGDLLSRPGLDIKTREMLTVAALTAMGNAPGQLELHMRGAPGPNCWKSSSRWRCMRACRPA